MELVSLPQTVLALKRKKKTSLITISVGTGACYESCCYKYSLIHQKEIVPLKKVVVTDWPAVSGGYSAIFLKKDRYLQKIKEK